MSTNNNYPSIIDFTGPLYVTRKTEGVVKGSNHIFNKEVYTLYGEYSGTSPKDLISKVTATKDQNCSFTSLSIEESKGIGKIWPYRAECECYYFKSGEGIIDFKNEINATENMDGTISASRNVSVQAISTPNNTDPVSSALILVKQFSGQNSPITIGTKSIPSLNSIILVSENLSIDKANGICNLQQNYIANAKSSDIGKRGIIKQLSEYQSGIDGIITQTKRTTIIGGTGMPDYSLVGIGNTTTIDSNLQLISKNVIEDSGQNVIDIISIYSNDKTIDANAGCKCSNSLTFNYDFINRLYTANYTAESSPASAMISGQALKSCLVTLDTINTYDPCGLSYNLISTTTGGANSKLIQSDNYISSNSASFVKIGNSSGFNASIQINYQPGYHYNTASPVLSGAGQWYIEDMGLALNAILGGTVSVNYGDAAPSQSDLYNLMSTGFPFSISAGATLIKDEYSIDGAAKKASYTYAAICPENTFKDLAK